MARWRRICASYRASGITYLPTIRGATYFSLHKGGEPTVIGGYAMTWSMRAMSLMSGRCNSVRSGQACEYVPADLQCLHKPHGYSDMTENGSKAAGLPASAPPDLVEQPQDCGADRRGGLIGRVELRHGVVDVEVYRAFTNSHQFGDFPRRFSLARPA